MKRSIIIVAGGKGLRAGGSVPKQFQLLGGNPVLMRTIEAFYAYDSSMRIIVVLPAGFDDLWSELCVQYNFNIPVENVEGGETRFHSVKNALVLISDEEIIGIHDAARPFVSSKVIDECFRTASEKRCGAIPIVDEVNSVRYINNESSITLNRKRVKCVQTPQVFPVNILKKAYLQSYSEIFTDDASVVENAGFTVELVNGDISNIKITTPLDFAIGEIILKST